MGAALGIQLALGGIATFWTADTIVGIHTGWGVVLGILAIVTFVYVMRTPNKPKPLVGITVSIGVDMLLQAILGFATRAYSYNNYLAYVHFLNALVIFGLAMVGTTMSLTAARMGQAHQAAPSPMPQPGAP